MIDPSTASALLRSFADCDPSSGPLIITAASNDEVNIRNCSVGRISVGDGVSNLSVAMTNVSFVNGAGGAGGWAVVVLDGTGLENVNVTIVNGSLSSSEVVERLITFGTPSYTANSTCSVDVSSLSIAVKGLVFSIGAGIGFTLVSLGCFTPSGPPLANSLIACKGCSFGVTSSSFVASGSGSVTMMLHQTYFGVLSNVGSIVNLTLMDVQWVIGSTTVTTPQSTNHLIQIGASPISGAVISVRAWTIVVTVVNVTLDGYGMLLLLCPTTLVTPAPSSRFDINVQNVSVGAVRLTSIARNSLVMAQGPTTMDASLHDSSFTTQRISNISVTLWLCIVTAPTPGPSLLVIDFLMNVSNVQYVLSSSNATDVFIALIQTVAATNFSILIDSSRATCGMHSTGNNSMLFVRSNVTQFSLDVRHSSLEARGNMAAPLALTWTIIAGYSTIVFLDNNVTAIGVIVLSISTVADLAMEVRNSSNSGIQTFLLYSIQSSLSNLSFNVTHAVAHLINPACLFASSSLADCQFYFGDSTITSGATFFVTQQRMPISGSVSLQILRCSVTSPYYAILWNSSTALGSSTQQPALTVSIENSSLSVTTLLLLDMGNLIGPAAIVRIAYTQVAASGGVAGVYVVSLGWGSSIDLFDTDVSSGFIAFYSAPGAYIAGSVLTVTRCRINVGSSIIQLSDAALLSNVTIRFVSTTASCDTSYIIRLSQSESSGTGTIRIAVESNSSLTSKAQTGIIVAGFAPIVAYSSTSDDSSTNGVLFYVVNSSILTASGGYCFFIFQNIDDTINLSLSGSNFSSGFPIYILLGTARLVFNARSSQFIGVVHLQSPAVTLTMVSATFVGSNLANMQIVAAASNITLIGCSAMNVGGAFVQVEGASIASNITLVQTTMRDAANLIELIKSSSTAAVHVYIDQCTIAASSWLHVADAALSSLSLTVESTVMTTHPLFAVLFDLMNVSLLQLLVQMRSSMLTVPSGSSLLAPADTKVDEFFVTLFNTSIACDEEEGGNSCPFVLDCDNCSLAMPITIMLDRANFSGFGSFVSLPSHVVNVSLYCSRWNSRWLTRKLRFRTSIELFDATSEFHFSLQNPSYQCPKLYSLTQTRSSITPTRLHESSSASLASTVSDSRRYVTITSGTCSADLSGTALSPSATRTRSVSATASCPIRPSYASTAVMSTLGAQPTINQSSTTMASVLAAGSVVIELTMFAGVTPLALGANVSSTLGTVTNVSIVSSSTKAKAGGEGDLPKSAAVVATTLSFSDVDLLAISLVSSTEIVVHLHVPIIGACIPDAFATREVFVATLLPLVTVTALQQVVRTSNRGAVSASAALGNPVGALTTTGMVSILSMGQCEFSDVDPLDPSVSPLGFAVGPQVGQYNRGAAITALGVYGSWMVLVAAATLVLQRWQPLAGALALLRFPSLMMVVVGVFHQGLATVSVSLIRGPEADADVALGAGGLLACAVMTLYAAFATTTTMKRSCVMRRSFQFRALAWERRVPGLGQLLRLSTWDQHWEDVSGISWKRRNLLLISDLRMPWWTAVEMLSAVVQGAILGVRLNSDGVCRGLMFAISALSAAMLSAAAYVRPCGPFLDNAFLILSKLAALVIAVLVLACLFEGGADSSSCASAEVVGAIATLLSYVQTVTQFLAASVMELREAAAAQSCPNNWLKRWAGDLLRRFATSLFLGLDPTNSLEESDSLQEVLVDDSVGKTPLVSVDAGPSTGRLESEMLTTNIRHDGIINQALIEAKVNEMLLLLRSIARRSADMPLTSSGLITRTGDADDCERRLRLDMLLRAASVQIDVLSLTNGGVTSD